MKGVLNRKCRYRNRPISEKPETFRSHIGNSESRGTKSEIKFAKIADLNLDLSAKNIPRSAKPDLGDLNLDRQDTLLKKYDYFEVDLLFLNCTSCGVHVLVSSLKYRYTYKLTKYKLNLYIYIYI